MANRGKYTAVANVHKLWHSCGYLFNHSVYTLCRWFEGFDWEGLQKRNMIPPIIPNVSCFSCLLVQGKLGCCWIIHWFIYISRCQSVAKFCKCYKSHTVTVQCFNTAPETCKYTSTVCHFEALGCVLTGCIICCYLEMCMHPTLVVYHTLCLAVTCCMC